MITRKIKIEEFFFSHSIIYFLGSGGEGEECYILLILYLAFINFYVPVPPTFWVPITPLMMCISNVRLLVVKCTMPNNAKRACTTTCSCPTMVTVLICQTSYIAYCLLIRYIYVYVPYVYIEAKHLATIKLCPCNLYSWGNLAKNIVCVLKLHCGSIVAFWRLMFLVAHCFSSVIQPRFSLICGF